MRLGNSLAMVGARRGITAIPTHTAPTVAIVGPLAAVGIGVLTVSLSALAYVTNDFAVMAIETERQTVALVTPAGWTALTVYASGTIESVGSTSVSRYTKRLTATMEVDPTFAATDDHATGQIFIIRGCPTGSDPVLVDTGISDIPGSNPVSGQTATSTIDNTLILDIWARANDLAGAFYSAETNASLTALTELSDDGTALNNGGGLAAWGGVKTYAGAINSTSVTAVNTAFHLARSRLVLAGLPFP